MKIITNVLMVLATGLIVFNGTQLNFAHLMEGQSLIALIGIVSATCALLVLWLFKLSKKVNDHFQG